MKNELIHVSHLHPRVVGDRKGKYLVQFAGTSMKNSAKLGMLQVWNIPFNSREEAQEYLNAMTGRKIIINHGKQSTLAY